MKGNIVSLILLTILNLSSQAIPIWKFEGLTKTIYDSSSSSGTLEEETFHHDNYQMIKEFSKDGDRIIIKNYLKIYGNKKEVPYFR